MSDLDKIAAALVAFQADLKPVGKTADNPFFKSKYAPLPTVMEAVQPLLAQHKLAISQFVTHIDGNSALRTILLHESGQYLEDVQPMLLAKQDPQGQGSAITYARRYGVMAVLGIVADEDDDGNAGSYRHTDEHNQQSDTRESTTTNKPKASPNKPPTDAQLGLIKKLATEAGYGADWYAEVIMKINSSADASVIIEKLKGGE
jgi:hypothetical protein